MNTTQTTQAFRTDSDRTIVAKMIRKDLKATYPGTKFSVTSERSTVRISWSMGPSAPAVEELVGKYEAGSFDGSDDCYKFRSDRPDHATVMYIFTGRDTDAVEEQVARDICVDFGVPFAGMSTYVAGEYVDVLVYRALRNADLSSGYHGVHVADGRIQAKAAPESMSVSVSGTAPSNDNGVA